MTKFTVYSKPGCVQCKATIRHLEEKGYEYEVVNANTSQMDELRQEGWKSFPVVKTSDGKSWSGYQPDKLK